MIMNDEKKVSDEKIIILIIKNFFKLFLLFDL